VNNNHVPHSIRTATPRELIRRINRRAYRLSTEAYERYRSEIEAAIAEGAISSDEIDNYQPALERSP
jgi:hypothetical protein